MREETEMPRLVQHGVYFEPRQISDARWDIRVHSPGGETVYITGFESEEETKNWLYSDQRREWLKERGWERWDTPWVREQ